MTEPPAQPRVSTRDVGIAGAYALATIALWAAHTSLTDMTGLPLPVPRAVVLLLLVAASAAIALRRARPGTMFALTGGLGMATLLLDGGLGGVLVLFEAVFSAVLHGTRRLMAITTVLCIGTTAALLLWGLVAQDLRPQWFAMGMQAFVVLILPLLWAGEVRRHREARAQAERAAAAEREVAAQQIELEQARTALRLQEQRTHLAQELHDGVTGHLSAVALQTGALRSSTAHGCDPEALGRSLDAVRASALEAMADMRRLIDVLRTDGPHDAGPSSWDGLIARLRALRPDASIDVRTEAIAELEHRGISPQVLRIGQEAVTNLLKHSGPGPVSLSLAAGADRSADDEPTGRAVELTVDSPLSRAASADDGAGLGLPSMTRRAEETGGRLEAGPVVGAVWRVRAVWPQQALPAPSPRSGAGVVASSARGAAAGPDPSQEPV